MTLAYSNSAVPVSVVPFDPATTTAPNAYEACITLGQEEWTQLWNGSLSLRCFFDAAHQRGLIIESSLECPEQLAIYSCREDYCDCDDIKQDGSSLDWSWTNDVGDSYQLTLNCGPEERYYPTMPGMDGDIIMFNAS